MDDKRKRLLASASALAVSAGLLATPPSATPVARPAAWQVLPSEPLRSSDPVVELALRLGGQGTADVVSGELRALLTPLSPERIEQLPRLVRDLRGLGLSARAQEAAEATLIELLASADPPLSDRQLDELAAAFASGPERIHLAAVPASSPGASRVSDQGRDRIRARGVGLYSG